MLTYLFYPAKYLNIAESVQHKNKCKQYAYKKLYQSVNQMEVKMTITGPPKFNTTESKGSEVKSYNDIRFGTTTKSGNVNV